MEQPGPPGQKGGGDMLIDLHVADRQGHVPVPVGDEQIGGGGPAGHGEALADVDAQLAAGGGDTLGVHIVAEGGEHPHVQPHQSHVVGDVAPHAPQAHAHLARVGVRRHQLPVGPPADVQVDAPHDYHIRSGADDVALAGDMALLHQIGDVYRHRRAGDARFVRQLLLGDQGVLLNPLENLPFPLSHGLSS